MTRPPPSPPPFPYPTLSRSPDRRARVRRRGVDRDRAAGRTAAVVEPVVAPALALAGDAIEEEALRARCPDVDRRIERLHVAARDRKSTRLNSSHANISYAVF